MNKVLLIVNIVLLAALAYLYYAFFNHKDSATKITQPTVSKTSFKIAYFDMDTLEKYYVLAKETRDYLKSKNDAMENKLNNIREQYQAKVNDYNKRGASLSQTEQSQMQEELQRLDGYYSQQQQTLSQDFQGEYMQKMVDLKNNIENFLKGYSVQKGYEYIFSTSSDDNVIYYKDSVRNITTDIVDQLNKNYKDTKKK